jgi:hypothetical protein
MHFGDAENYDFQDTSPNVPRISRIHKSRTTKAKSILSDFMIKTVRPYDMNLTKVHLYELLRNTGANIVEDEKMLLKTDLIPILIGNANPSAEVMLLSKSHHVNNSISRTRTAREKSR